MIDYSQWRTWKDCPAKWYEQTVNKRVKRWPEGQRDDALAIGTLVHEGLRVWQQAQTPVIPEETLLRIGPTPEARMACEQMVMGYAMKYPQEQWPLMRCEQPIKFPLLQDGSEGLAKLDAYFRVDEPTFVESGVPGYQIILSPGLWVHEYKTKDPTQNIGRFIQKWQTNMQVNFQLLALRALTGEWPQGVLVNVIEKPRVYIPKRTCKKCGVQSEMAAWGVGNEGLSTCPFCRNEQKLSKPTGESVPPNYLRIATTRTPEVLENARAQIQKDANQMEVMRVWGLGSQSWNQEKCVDSIYGACPYFNNHLYGLATTDDPEMIEAEDYIGEVQG